MNDDLIIGGVAAAIVGGVVFVAVDAFSGRHDAQPAAVTAHNYVPPDTHCSTDSKGHLDCHTDSEEYRICVRLQDGSGMVFTVSQSEYAAIRDGEHVTASYLIGRFTGWRYPAAGAVQR